MLRCEFSSEFLPPFLGIFDNTVDELGMIAVSEGDTLYLFYRTFSCDVTNHLSISLEDKTDILTFTAVLIFSMFSF